MKTLKTSLIIVSLVAGLQVAGAATKSGDAIGPMYLKGGRSIIDPHPTASKSGIIAPMYIESRPKVVAPGNLRGGRSITTPNCLIKWSR